MNRRVVEVAMLVLCAVSAFVVDVALTPEAFEVWSVGTLGVQVLAGTVLTVVTARLYATGPSDLLSRTRTVVRTETGPRRRPVRLHPVGGEPPPLRVAWFIPVAVVAVLSPTIVTGGLGDDVNGFGSVLLFLLLSYGALLLGLLVAMMLVLPLTLLAAVVVGKVPAGARVAALPVALLLPAVVGLALGATFGLDLPGAALPGLVLGLLGLGDAEVTSVGWLWVGRVSALALVGCVWALLVARRSGARAGSSAP